MDIDEEYCTCGHQRDEHMDWKEMRSGKMLEGEEEDFLIPEIMENVYKCRNMECDCENYCWIQD